MNTTIYPKHTPWGAPHTTTIVAEGIVRYTTGSHGGYWLSQERVASMPDGLRPKELEVDCGAWFEEDEQWTLVALAFQMYFDDGAIQVARRTVVNWMPEVWEAWTGEKVTPAMSHRRAREVFLEQHKSDQIVVAAFGSWDKTVPKGMVGVVAVTGGRVSGTLKPPETYWLVDEAEYADAHEQPGYTGDFVIDPSRHQPWPREVLVKAA
ncbi:MULTISPECIES: DUF7007 domain-containing protein [Pandoraea]|uniref:DUF7007 domain-containing protein n=2 Tax=Pandoraea TaxID=93217 RepID=A0A5E4XEB8_9BURK|nr:MULTISPECIES: hypothetical protein [Pandoraea]VVE16838.1 hypothetical protein PCE31107_02939 [Pandoraea cepalis]VVE34647.1 hypothetical protein PTE31013_03860 [Pandoraea terrigena]